MSYVVTCQTCSHIIEAAGDQTASRTEGCRVCELEKRCATLKQQRDTAFSSAAKKQREIGSLLIKWRKEREAGE